jgi:hypothetical protein
MREERIGADIAQGHGDHEQRPHELRRCGQWNVEEAAAHADNEAEEDTQKTGDHR